MREVVNPEMTGETIEEEIEGMIEEIIGEMIGMMMMMKSLGLIRLSTLLEMQKTRLLAIFQMMLLRRLPIMLGKQETR
jgi:hypothetical protein